MESVVIVIAFVVLTYFLAKPKGPKRKSKKFGQGLFDGGSGGFDFWGSY